MYFHQSLIRRNELKENKKFCFMQQLAGIFAAVLIFQMVDQLILYIARIVRKVKKKSIIFYLTFLYFFIAEPGVWYTVIHCPMSDLIFFLYYCLFTNFVSVVFIYILLCTNTPPIAITGDLSFV